MTQCLLLIGQCQELPENLDVQLKHVHQEEPIMLQAAHELFSGAIENCWTIVAPETDISDTLFTEAQQLLHRSDIPFETTRLGRMLIYLTECASSVALWYSDDWHDLPVVEHPAEFLAQVKDQVLQPTCETYLRFERGMGNAPVASLKLHH